MAFTPVEWIALVLIALATIKIIVLLVKPMAWMKFAKSIYSKPKLAQFVAFVLAVIVFYYLVWIGPITIVQLLATAAFVALLFGMALANHVDDLIKELQGLIKRGKIWKEYWLYTLIWVILLAWGIKEIFGM